jgi:hypothetical protein
MMSVILNKLEVKNIMLRNNRNLELSIVSPASGLRARLAELRKINAYLVARRRTLSAVALAKAEISH